MKNLRALFSRQWLLATILVLAGGAVCIRLGIWQLNRLELRHIFNERVESAWAQDALILQGKKTDDLELQEYRTVTVSGIYDFENQVALRNRHFQNEYGYHLLTPLLLEDGSAVLVDRGWIPATENDTPNDWHKYDLSEAVTVHGQMRLGSIKPDIGGVPDPELAPGQDKLEFWNIVNLERIQLQLPYPLLAVYIQPNINAEDTTPPIPYQPEIELSEGPHQGYALQWFTYASILLFGYPFYIHQQTKEKS